MADLLEREYQVSDCLYWMALTLYGVGDIRASRTHCERLLRMDPSNNKALALHDCIKDVAAKGSFYPCPVLQMGSLADYNMIC